MMITNGLYKLLCQWRAVDKLFGDAMIIHLA